MRILFLTPSVRLLGARQSLLALVRRLPEEGGEPLVVCPGVGGLTEELQRLSIPVEVVRHGAWRKLKGRLEAEAFQLPALRRIVKKFQPDVIHCNEFHSTPQGVRAAGRMWGMVGVTSHVRLGITPRQIRNYDLGRCHRIAAVSEACRGLFEDSGLIDRVEVVPNGVDVGELWGKGGDRSLRAELGWGEEELVVGLLGLVSPRKNQMVAVEAVAEANRRGVPARLLLAGDAFKSTLEYGEELRARLERDDLCGKAAWLPFQKDVARLYGALDLNLLISAEEGFGRTIIEAGALGIPSIGARTGGIPELILEGKTGWLVDEGSVEDLAGVLESVWKARGELDQTGEKAREHVRERFTIEAHVAAMREFWERAIEAARSNG